MRHASPTRHVSQVHEYPITTAGTDPAFGQQLKVTLVWTDVAGAPQAANPLVNDLHLEVLSAGQTYRGNGGLGTANSPPDNLNTQEQVAIQLPGTGAATHTVRVVGADVRQGPQKYALVVTGPLNNPSPPPAPPAPPPSGQGLLSGSNTDSVVLGVTIPLLIIALGAGGAFMFFRSRNKGDGPMKPAGAGGLPPGWTKSTDPTTGVPYYVEAKTGRSQWEAPMAAAAMPPPPPPAADALPPGWSEGVDPASGRTYWYKAATKESQWTRPTA